MWKRRIVSNRYKGKQTQNDRDGWILVKRFDQLKNWIIHTWVKNLRKRNFKIFK